MILSGHDSAGSHLWRIPAFIIPRERLMFVRDYEAEDVDSVGACGRGMNGVDTSWKLVMSKPQAAGLRDAPLSASNGRGPACPPKAAWRRKGCRVELTVKGPNGDIDRPPMLTWIIFLTFLFSLETFLE